MLDDAVEFAGRSLFIRLKCTGIVSVKTAESHYLLGLVYFKKEFDEEARKELTAGENTCFYCIITSHHTFQISPHCLL